MPPLTTKPVLAGALLVGVSIVWMPHLTGLDPFGLLPEEESLGRSEAPSSESVKEARRVSARSSGAGTMERAERLEDILEFFETHESIGPMTPGAGSDPDRPIITVLSEADGETDKASCPNALEEFVRENPLHMIVEGKGLTTATFGAHRVQAGDSLTDAGFYVESIGPDTVTLTLEDERLRVHLPAVGSLGFRIGTTDEDPGNGPESEEN